MYEKNSFITLTYNDENLKSPFLVYEDYQKFISDLRTQRFTDLLNRIFPDDNQITQRTRWKQLSREQKDHYHGEIQIGHFTTGEYGDQRKRPHWHTLLFNYRPSDLVFKYTSERGDLVYSSASLDRLWKKGITEVGSVTFHSAGYCARYAAKKLVHGNDQEHSYQPIHKRSTRHAIGKAFLEKHYKDIFNYGFVDLDGQKMGIPRYYEKWFRKEKPDEWLRYVTETKNKKILKAEARASREKEEEDRINWNRLNLDKPLQITKHEVQKVIIEQKFNQLQKHLKGDI